MLYSEGVFAVTLMLQSLQRILDKSSLRIKCYGVTANKCTKNMNKVAIFCGYSEVSVNFNQCNTDVTKVTVNSQYANFTNQMLQCYSFTAHPRAKNQKIS